MFNAQPTGTVISRREGWLKSKVIKAVSITWYDEKGKFKKTHKNNPHTQTKQTNQTMHKVRYSSFCHVTWTKSTAGQMNTADYTEWLLQPDEHNLSHSMIHPYITHMEEHSWLHWTMDPAWWPQLITFHDSFVYHSYGGTQLITLNDGYGLMNTAYYVLWFICISFIWRNTADYFERLIQPDEHNLLRFINHPLIIYVVQTWYLCPC